MRSIQLLITALMVSISTVSFSQTICSAEDNAHGALQIHETQLSKKSYSAALEELAILGNEEYFVKNEIHFSIRLSNALKTVEGYSLRNRALQDENDKYGSITIFCSWLKRNHWSD